MTAIKTNSIKQFLSSIGIEPMQERAVYGMYLSPFRSETVPSFKVDYHQNLWYDFGSGEGGSIIDLVMKLDRCTATEAMRRLQQGHDFSFHCVDSVHTVQSPLQIVSVEPLQDARLIHYLQSARAIDFDIDEHYCREVHYTTNGKPFFAVGFQSDAGGWELRNAYFKGCASPKGITTFRTSSDTCLLFEGFMDMLSYLTLKRVMIPTLGMAVLNSVNNLRQAHDFLRQHRTIHCFLDNDDSGKRTVAQVEQLASEVIDHAAGFRPYTDLTEYLCGQRQKVEKKPPKRTKGLRR